MRDVTGLGSYVRFKKITEWMLHGANSSSSSVFAPVRASASSSSASSSASLGYVTLAAEGVVWGGGRGSLSESSWEGRTQALTLALKAAEARSRGEGGEGDGHKEGMGKGGGEGGGFPLVGPLAKWDVRGGWELSVWGLRFRLLVCGVVFGR